MSDLVNRLRWAATLGDLSTTSARNLMEAAAARIAQLKEDLEEARRERDQYFNEIVHLENGESV